MHIKKALLIGETKRLFLLCLEEPTFLEEVAKFKEALSRHGYLSKALNMCICRVPWHRQLDIIGKDHIPEEHLANVLLQIPTTCNPI